jgi:hypothetical protein
VTTIRSHVKHPVVLAAEIVREAIPLMHGKGERETAIAVYMQKVLDLAIANTEWGDELRKQPERKLLKEA